MHIFMNTFGNRSIARYPSVFVFHVCCTELIDNHLLLACMYR